MNDPIRMTWPMYRRRMCLYYGRRVNLSRKQAEVLTALLLRRGALVSCAELIESVYPNADEEPDFANDCIRSYIGRLRLKVRGLIVNSPSRGWTIDTPCEDDLREAA